MYQRRASGSLDIEEPYVMEKGKWMFNLMNQAYYEESYITNYQSLLNKKWNDLYIKSENWSYEVEYSKSQPLKSQW
jgi:hypothetical protein